VSIDLLHGQRGAGLEVALGRRQILFLITQRRPAIGRKQPRQVALARAASCTPTPG
jgi:hypothetical protein